MKSNRNARNLNERAEIGIGTLIVFIAAVLVAAVAAAVLIGTSGNLQQRSQQTGKEASESVGTNLELLNVWANRTLTTGDMKYLNVSVRTAAGSQAVDLNRTTIILTNSNGYQSFGFNWAANTGDRLPTATLFGKGVIYDADSSLSNNTAPSINSNDIAVVSIQLPSSMSLGPGSSLSIKIAQPAGTPLIADVVTPQAYGTDLVVLVR